MAKASARTGSGPTFMVAVEQGFPSERRIIDDPLALPILPLSLRAFARALGPAFARDWMVRTVEKRAPGIWSGLLCRKRYIDDAISGAVSRLDAVVNLGAGFDTRAYRLPDLREMPIWEVDLAVNIDPKRARLRKMFGEVPRHVCLVSIDFDRETPGEALAAHGWSPGMRTFFILEGVTQYLTGEGIRSTFGLLATAAAGSRVAFTYILEDFIAGRKLHRQRALYDEWVVKKRGWLFGLDTEAVPAFLDPYGWGVVENVSNEELAARYVEPTGRLLATTTLERLVYAEKR